MQIGSIVVVLPVPKDYIVPWVKWLPTDDGKTPYIIRSSDMCPVSGEIFRFEEGIMGFNPINKIESGMPKKYLREILPPEDISEHIEEIMSESITV